MRTPRLTVHCSPFTRNGSRRSGFTLLEVLVATVLMATVIVGLLSLIGQSLSNAAQVREYDRAAMLARTQMNELIALDKPPIGRALQGEIDDHTGWEAVIEPWEVPGGAAGSFLARIRLELWWQSAGQRKQIELEGFRRIRPTPEMQLELLPGQLF
jgi:type II secretion system protein I